MGLISRKLCRFLPMFSNSFISPRSYFFFFYRSPSSSLCTVFGSVLSNIDEILSINSSANVFVFGDFNVDHKGWLTYSGGTDGPGQLCYNFSISNDLTHMVNFPTRIRDCDSHSRTLLDLFISSDASICSKITYNYSRAGWDDLHGYLRDVPWEYIFKLSASAAASEFCEWVQVGIAV